MPMIIQEAYITPNRLDQKRNSSWHIIIRKTNALNNDRILKTVREKGRVTYKGRPIGITTDFAPETMEARTSWKNVIETLREHKCQPRLLYPEKLSITIDGETEEFHDKTKYTISFHESSPSKDNKGQTLTKEGNYALEKARK